MENSICNIDQLQVNICTSRKVRFKAGSDLSGKVNRVVVDVNENSSDDQHFAEIKIHLFTENCLKHQED